MTGPSESPAAPEVEALPAAGESPDLPFHEKARQALKEVFGFDGFREGQLRALKALDAGRDCLLIMPTGSGKSLCYQLPALLYPGVTLVISPLIALMKDQVDGLALKGIPVTCINSSLSIDEQWERLDRMRAGAYKLVYVAPERFRNRSFINALSQVKISLLAVDEAHCISQWGHDFRPDYRRLRAVRRLLGGVQAIALTATATPEVQDDIARELDMEGYERIVTGFDRPNLSFRISRVAGGEAVKLAELKEFLLRQVGDFDGEGAPAGIVYAGTRRHAENAAGFLNEIPWPHREKKDGPICKAYHAGLENAARREVQEDFMEGRLPWVTATNAFGMGVDKSDIRFVIHFDLPGSIEAYYQEVGRAGRDGLPAECLLLFSEADRRLQEFFIEGANPGRETITGVHRFLWSLGENPIFHSLSELEERFSSSEFTAGRINPLAFRTSVVVLEQAEALQRLDHFDNLAEARPCGEKSWSENPFREAAAVKHALWDGLAKVFQRTDGEPAQLRLEHWAAELGMSEESLRRGLHLLEQEGWIRYQPPFRGRAIRLAENLRRNGEAGVDFKTLEKRRRRDEERLEKVLALCRSRECRRNAILQHFGEAQPPGGCGACDRCRSAAAAERPGAAALRPLEGDDLLLIRKILSGVARAAGRCGRRRIVQMLLGSRAQGVLELGFDRLSTYGLLRGMPRDQIGQILDGLLDAGCVEEEGDRYRLLRLTRRGRGVMLAQEEIALALPRRGAANASRAAEEPEDFDDALFQRLRSLRRELAARHQVPAFRIFSDRTLKGMARLQPEDEPGLLSVPGVGKVTLSLFGQEFLKEIHLYLAERRGG